MTNNGWASWDAYYAWLRGEELGDPACALVHLEGLEPISFVPKQGRDRRKEKTRDYRRKRPRVHRKPHPVCKAVQVSSYRRTRTIYPLSLPSEYGRAEGAA